jgi:hypothetical protein
VNRSNDWNGKAQCNDSRNSKDSGVVVCRNPVRNEELNINQRLLKRYNSLATYRIDQSAEVKKYGVEGDHAHRL